MGSGASLEGHEKSRQHWGPILISCTATNYNVYLANFFANLFIVSDVLSALNCKLQNFMSTFYCLCITKHIAV